MWINHVVIRCFALQIIIDDNNIDSPTMGGSGVRTVRIVFLSMIIMFYMKFMAIRRLAIHTING